MKRILLSAMMVLMTTTIIIAQRTISGTVTDSEGNPLIGANVFLAENQSVGTITDFDGHYKLEVPEDAGQLTFTFIGYLNKTVDIGASNIIDVSLEQDKKLIEEVVVVGYGEQSKKFLTQSIAKIDGSAIANKPIVSPQQALQGLAAGVQMVNSSGVLGAASVVRVRGPSSILASSAPLYVIDGVPLNTTIQSLDQGGGTGLNPLLSLNPNNIESISVLKDASATAIYGSRGSNGVILIETKDGKYNEETRINLNMYTGASRITGLYDMMNTDQFVTTTNAYREAQGFQTITLPEKLRNSNFNWPDAVTRTGKVNSINLSTSGGSKRTKFYINGTYYNEEGFTIGNELTKYSGRINLEHRVRDWLTVGANIANTLVTGDRIGVENNTFAPLTSAMLILPYVQPRDSAGNFVSTGFIENTIALEALNTNKHLNNRIIGNAFIEIEPIKGLEIKTLFGVDRVHVEQKQRNNDLFSPGGYAYKYSGDENKYVTTTTAQYEWTGDDHAFTILGGYSFGHRQWRYVQLEGIGFSSNSLPNIGSASSFPTTDEYGEASAIESFFARGNYRFMNKYLVEASIRRDGSSVFPENNKYGTFYGMGVGYILSAEDFLKNSDVVNFLKIRASYGLTGNDRIGGTYPYQGLYAAGTAGDYFGVAGLIPSQVPNPDLKWEETSILDVGFEVTLFNNLWDLEVSYYIKNTTDLILPVTYPYTTGFSSATKNLGEMKNTGVDLLTRFHILRTGDWRFTFGLNAGYLHNEITKLSDDLSEDRLGNLYLKGSSSQRAVVGKSLNEFYLIRFQGIDPETGDAIWLDADGNETKTPSSSDRAYVGSAIPDLTGGATIDLSWKFISLSAIFNYTYGNYVYLDGLGFTDNILSPSFNKSVKILNYWKKPGDQAFAPALGSSTVPYFNTSSTLQLQNGSFLRLRNVTLAFNIPNSVLNYVGAVKKLRIYVSGQNLWLLKAEGFRGQDPEVSANGSTSLVMGESFFALPQAKTWRIGVNLQF